MVGVGGKGGEGVAHTKKNAPTTHPTPPQGLCDNLVTSVLRAWDWGRAPLLLAPAMNTAMWESPLTPRHVATVTALGAIIVPPIAKALACGDVGVGAMAKPATVAAAVRRAAGVAE